MLIRIVFITGSRKWAQSSWKTWPTAAFFEMTELMFADLSGALAYNERILLKKTKFNDRKALYSPVLQLISIKY